MIKYYPKIPPGVIINMSDVKSGKIKLGYNGQCPNENEIYLRPLEVSDYVFINMLRDDEGVFPNIMGNKFYISAEREKKWIQYYVEKGDRGGRY